MTSKIPDNVKNPKLYKKIKAKIRRDVDKKNRQWGAYDSGRLVREYKAAGGTYSGKKSKNSPFDGMLLEGRNIKTFVRGRLVYEL